MKRLALQLRQSNHLVAEVDAWATDHADDPLLAVMAAIEDAAKPLMAKPVGKKLKATLSNLSKNAGGITVAALKGAALQGARKFLGDAIDDVSEIIDGSSAEEKSTIGAIAEAGAKGASDAALGRLETLLDQAAAEQVNLFRRGQVSILAFKQDLAKLTGILGEKGMSPTLFVLIDELDRCRPTYAISLLERAKHLFEVDNVSVIVATDTAQLVNSVRAVYGADFDSRRYLGRFFDRSYEFDRPSLLGFIEELLIVQPIDAELVSVPPNQTMLSTMVHIFSTYGSTPRDIQRCYDLVRTVATTWSSKAKIELTALLPLAIAYQAGLAVTWDDKATEDFLSVSMPGVSPMTWKHREESTFNMVDAKVRITDLTRLWKQYVSGPLSGAVSTQTSKPAGNWVIEGLRDEFRLVHNKQHTVGSVPMSIVTQYPSIIAKAGRFSA